MALQRRVVAAFSLVEVVIAVGVFAVAVVSVIGIMAAVGKSVADVQESEKASRLVGVVQARLQYVSFTGVANALKTEANLQTNDADASYDPSTDPKVFFASEDGSILRPYSDTVSWGLNGTLTTKEQRDGLKFFELAFVRNPILSPDDTGGFIAFNIRVRWPAYLPDGTRVTDNTQKGALIVPAAVTR